MKKYLRLRLDHLLFALFAAVAFLFNNNLGFDYYWHLKAGEYLAQQGYITSVDPFSFSAANKPWVMHEWLYELVLYYLHAYMGVYGVKLLSAVLISLSLYITYSAAINLSNNRNVSLVLAAASFFLLYSFNLPRPQLFTYLFLAIYLHVLLGYKYHLYKAKQLYVLPLVMLLWVNMHGGYIVGIALLILFAVTEAIDGYLNSEKELNHPSLRPLLVTIALCILASLFNPYTYHHWIYPFDVMAMSANAYIMEWLSPDFHLRRFKLYLLFVFLYIFFRNYNNNRSSITEAGLPLFFIIMSFISRRHIPIALIILLPFYVKAIQGININFDMSGRLGKLICSWKKVGLKQKRNVTFVGERYLINWVILLAFAVVTLYVHTVTKNRIALFETAVPVGAVEFIKNTGISGNVFNSYNYGGYLIYSLYPDSRVFIDGRMDMYGDKHLFEHQQIENAAEGWRKLLNSYPVDYILINNQVPLNHFLCHGDEFKIVFRDAMSAIYVRNNERFEPIIMKFEKYTQTYNRPCED